MREMLAHAVSMRGSSAFQQCTAGHTYCAAPVEATREVRDSSTSGSYCQFSRTALSRNRSNACGCPTAMSAHIIGCRPRSSRYEHSSVR